MSINNNILFTIRNQNTGESEVLRMLASSVKKRRLERNLTQANLAKQLNIPLPTYRRFEQLGELSLRNFVKIALFFDDLNALQNLFSRKTYASIENVLDAEKSPRQRARS